MKSRGKISLVFDDGYASVYEHVVPLLNDLNMPGVFAVPLSTTSLERSLNRTFTPWTTWVDIKKNGHEIAAHSETHTDLTQCAPDSLIRELSEPERLLGSTTIVYPGGGHNDSVKKEAKQYYKAGRTVLHGFEAIPPKDPMALKTYNFTRNNFSATKANLLAMWAYATNSWLIETYHIVDDNEHEHIHAVSLQELIKHLRFISRLPVEVVTIQDITKDL